MERTLDDWIAEVRAELDIDLDVDVRGLLDLARVVAHGVDRPAAPLTAILAVDNEFHEELPTVFPHFPGAKDYFTE
ncbi:DUF6457 domain-containing protein, partial [Kitasatospora putterlickiae]|uniref:DUF6457 domain-containing protein n=1 Tax=Kitasatospora putterlickiae TaxID=221725 RepID=UPI0031DC3B5E